MSHTSTSDDLSTKKAPAKRKSASFAVVTTLIVAVLILIALIVFIAQNGQRVHISYFGADAHLGFGVALLLAAVAGALIATLIGGVLRVRRSLRSRH